ncbi:hypothetical protein EJ02DRAFT_442323 [Clathrospora elynae]|uniref:SET domain-containing protein n=1 Tax=Clathrospora elynae TaxID=706981 RepID=A0A6A5T206_9PLEO|nr:hypothetical protein EJ02DRAFT_442323 [Clathrospora elynae]
MSFGTGFDLFEVQSIPEKGKGLVARSNIAKVLIEKPLFTLDPEADLVESSVVSKVKALSKDKQRQFLALHNNFPGKNVFSGVFRTNALPCGPESVVGAVYPTICLINHCCDPNSHNNWNNKTSSETIHAVRDMKAGEEIMIPYAKQEASFTRRALLKSSFGFDCSCSLCSLPVSELKKSEARRLRIEELDQAIGEPSRLVNAPTKALADCQEMARVIEEEFPNGSASPLEASLYYDAFQISITHGDEARASAFAERAYRARVICEGEDSPETENMERLMNKPTIHRNYGISKRWRMTKNMVSKGLDGKEFDE